MGVRVCLSGCAGSAPCPALSAGTVSDAETGAGTVMYAPLAPH